MAFYQIGKHWIFYSDDRFKEINRPFCENLDPHELMMLKIRNFDGSRNENARKLDSHRINALYHELEMLSSKEFIDKWVKFKFEKEQARNLGWTLITNYFEIHKNGRIIDNRDFTNKLMEEAKGNGYTFPQGEVITLEFQLSKLAKFSFSNINSKNSLRITLNLSSILKIFGSLDNLIIHTKKKIIVLSKNIEIIEKM